MAAACVTALPAALPDHVTVAVVVWLLGGALLVVSVVLITNSPFVPPPPPPPQPNYGFGGTYWSIGREDNGSLPLNVLGVDGALLDWGKCKVGLSHVGYYLDNYIRAGTMEKKKR